MRHWHSLEEVPHDWNGCVATIGVFDGVHRGHQALVGRAVSNARERGLPAVVVTFEPHPDEVIRPGTHPMLLCTPERRAELLGELGADAVLVMPFTPELAQMGPDDFVHSVLVERLRTKLIVVGENFRFGHRARGDVSLLRELGEKHDFTAEGVVLVANGPAISSSSIRAALEEGRVEDAARALGRPHRVEGVVVSGARRGRELGFPTANLQTPPYTAIPADGVYAGWLRAPGQRAHWPAAISIGVNPTFEGGAERHVEAYALDRDDLELYGEHVGVDFVSRIRDTLKFESVADLVAEMHRDVDRAREITATRRA